MAGPAYLSDPYVQFLSRLLDELAAGDVLIPAFQRRLVWDDSKRIELLRSIRDGIPIGSVLVWRTKLQSVRPLEVIGPHKLPSAPESPAHLRTYLLDGLQRLSTLYVALRPLPAGASPFVDENGERRSWLFTYDLVDEDFRVEPEGSAVPETRLPLTVLLDSGSLLRFERKLAKRDDGEVLIARADAIAETFRDYKLPVIPIVGDDLADATRTFQRINSQGTEMSELHMVRALTWTPEYDLEDELESAADILESVRWGDLPLDIVLEATKTYLGLDVWKEAPDALSGKLRTQPNAVKGAAAAVASACQFLSQRCKIPGPRMMTYSAQIVLLAEACRAAPNPTPVAVDRLVKWFWLTTYAGLFAGISGGQLKRQLAYVRALSEGQSPKWPGPKPLRFEVDPVARFEPRSVRTRAASLRLAALAPLDRNGVAINAYAQLGARGPTAMQHIIPADAAGSLGSSIANRMFAGDDAGELRFALAQFPDKVDKNILASHAISPDAARALAEGSYQDFLVLRREAIVHLQREFIANLPGDMPAYSMQ